ncbi:hypothetical protein [Ramlibacter sp. PS4R-6]|uniref:hypothetical protein n=1 Tax=Ramlibacter sp. PS4R-6 TaxID=3133438 RepID=UPI0030B1D19B
MLPPLLDKTQPSPADKWLWALLGFLVVGQVVALWMLCSQQVHKAEVREAELRLARSALRDDCAPRGGHATCLPAAAAQARRQGDVNAVMAALR